MKTRFVGIAPRHRIGLLEITYLFVGILLAIKILYYISSDRNFFFSRHVDLIVTLSLCIILTIGLALLCWRRVVEQEGEIQRRILAECEARFLADHDQLTGLPNRRQLAPALEAAMTIHPNAERVHALFVLDLNGLKRINDVFGHHEGDVVLNTAAQRIAAVLRDGDLMVRTCGDEFSIVARDLQGTEEAAAIANRILFSLKDPIMIGSELHTIGTGIGVALIPHDGRDPHHLQRKADIALRRSKAIGRSAVTFFSDEMEKEARERDSLQRDLRRAVSDQSIVAYYQPIVDLRTGNIKAFEALARWTHPMLGEISPERFIPIAEDNGLITPLTKMLLAQACAEALTWPDHVTLSFNLSPMLLHDDYLDEWLLGIVRASGLPEKRLEIEITEHAVAKDLQAAKRSVRSLRHTGIRIALDDFGTGSSSLSHLRSLEFDTIKIDRSFVNDMQSKESAAIIRALVGIGLGLGLGVIAEGIERQEQSDQLVENECMEGQGFLFGHALSGEDTRRSLRASHLPIVE